MLKWCIRQTHSNICLPISTKACQEWNSISTQATTVTQNRRNPTTIHQQATAATKTLMRCRLKLKFKKINNFEHF